MRHTLTLILGLVLGAGLNEWAAQVKHEGIATGLEIVGNRFAEDYASFAHRMAAFERGRATLCTWPLTKHNILWLQQHGEIGEICEP